jgi:glycosyltransferase involved in cell wall biosynthesis
VSVVIAARNEAAEIAACIASVNWAAEVIVVENDSTDDTVALAAKAGARAFRHPFSTIGAQRNAAIGRASHDWIFVVDADERGTPALAAVVHAAVTRLDGPSAYRATRRNFFFGREIRHGGWERDKPIRLFRRELRYDERPVHEHVIVDGEVGVLSEPLLHTPYADLNEYSRSCGVIRSPGPNSTPPGGGVRLSSISRCARSAVFSRCSWCAAAGATEPTASCSPHWPR